LIFLTLQIGIVQAYQVPTGSMERTIRPGDFLLADKLTLGPRTPHWIGIPWTDLGVHLPAVKLPGLRGVKRGDIVVFEVPDCPSGQYIKRVIGLPGDLVEVRSKQVWINGEPRDETRYVVHQDDYVLPPDYEQPGILDEMGNRDNFGPYRVPPGTVFLMGDNRDDSRDSRYFGAIPEDNIIGTARLIALSWNKETGAAPWDRLRIERFGSWLD